MAVLVDAAIWRWRGRRWCHLASDTSHEELHAFAAQLGIARRHFQGDHYDVPEELRGTAVTLGAVEVAGRDLVAALRRNGLRRPGARLQAAAAYAKWSYPPDSARRSPSPVSHTPDAAVTSPMTAAGTPSASPAAAHTAAASAAGRVASSA